MGDDKPSSEEIGRREAAKAFATMEAGRAELHASVNAEFLVETLIDMLVEKGALDPAEVIDRYTTLSDNLLPSEGARAGTESVERLLRRLRAKYPGGSPSS